jgi:ABC-2 type transport system permease protein
MTSLAFPTHRRGGSLAALSQRRGGLRRVFVIARALALAEFKLRYLEARLSFLWCVMRPLLTFAVLYLVLTHVGNFNHGVSHYGGYLLTSLVLWTFFAESTQTAVRSLVERRDLVRKAAFPRIAIPLSVTFVSLFDLAMNVIAMVVFLLVTGVAPRLSWLELPVLVLMLALLIAGTSMLLSVLYVRYRDLDQIWTLTRQILFYATPTLYVASALPTRVSHILSANPLAAIFTQSRRALIDPSAPSAASAIGGAPWLLVPVGIVAAVFVAGIVVFQRQGERIAEIV